MAPVTLSPKVLRDFVTSDRVEVNRLEAEAGLLYLSLRYDFADGVILLRAEQSRADRRVTFDRDFALAPTASKVPLIVLEH